MISGRIAPSARRHHCVNFISTGHAFGTPDLFVQSSLLFTRYLIAPSPLNPAASYRRCHSSSRDDIGEKALSGEPAKILDLIVLATTPKKNASRATPILTEIVFMATPLNIPKTRTLRFIGSLPKLNREAHSRPVRTSTKLFDLWHGNANSATIAAHRH